MRSLLLLLVATICLHIAASTRCFCTADDCEPFGVCDGKVCLVGALNDNGTIVRMCGNETISGCSRNVDAKFSGICGCDTPFCNTFVLFRRSMKDWDP